MAITKIKCRVSKSENHINLKWTTENGNPFVSFEIQKSVDGQNFSTIAIVDANKNRNNINQYSDQSNSISGKLFYRIKGIADLGKEFYSNTRLIFPDHVSIKSNIYPNPIEKGQTLFVVGNFEQGEELTVRVLNSIGMEVTKSTIVSDQNNIIEMKVPSNASAGIYIVEVISSTSISRQRITIK